MFVGSLFGSFVCDQDFQKVQDFFKEFVTDVQHHKRKQETCKL